MKALGVVRRIDELGRIVIPIEVRRANGWGERQPLEMFVDDGLFIMKTSDQVEQQEELKQTLQQFKKELGSNMSDELKERLEKQLDRIDDY